MNGRESTTVARTCCFAGDVLAGSWNQERGQNLNPGHSALTAWPYVQLIMQFLFLSEIYFIYLKEVQ